MTTEQRDGANSRVLSTDELDIMGRVMWIPRCPGLSHGMNWKRLTIDHHQMVVDWGDGTKTIDITGVHNIKIWPPESGPSNGDNSAHHPSGVNA